MMEESTHLTLYLLRHGKSVANVKRVFASRKVDPPLSPLGREQIKQQSKALASIKFDACYTSPLLRAVQSSEILSQQIGLQFAKTETLLEFNRAPPSVVTKPYPKIKIGEINDKGD